MGYADGAQFVALCSESRRCPGGWPLLQRAALRVIQRRPSRRHTAMDGSGRTLRGLEQGEQALQQP